FSSPPLDGGTRPPSPRSCCACLSIEPHIPSPAPPSVLLYRGYEANRPHASRIPTDHPPTRKSRRPFPPVPPPQPWLKPPGSQPQTPQAASRARRIRSGLDTQIRHTSRAESGYLRRSPSAQSPLRRAASV